MQSEYEPVISVLATPDGRGQGSIRGELETDKPAGCANFTLVIPAVRVLRELAESLRGRGFSADARCQLIEDFPVRALSVPRWEGPWRNLP
jgi:hypothetical protein